MPELLKEAIPKLARVVVLSDPTVPAGALELKELLPVDARALKLTILPSVSSSEEFVDAGGLMSYAADDADRYRRVAIYVDRILNGAKPADLPVEQPTKFELVINLKTAKEIGVIIPQKVLARADKVIR